ncbi:MAG: hypothetical protein ACKVY0_26880 [Prosthecobacter sp.]|uniref:hypothetical protein n=1 Tax=Prosthecobacter sp. TaxID=1965333 RepID=UPI003902121C
MPFDPTYPPTNAEIESAPLRGQFNGLKDLIDTIPVGPPGQNGSDGTSVTGAVIDNTTTLNPGNPAEASVSWDGANVRFTFGIPRGQDGVSSPPITSFIVDGVNTLNPGDNATVQTSFDGASVRMLFGIPRGSDGTNGSNGNDGGQGPPFTNFIVDGVNMLNPTDPASVQSNFDGNAVRIIFNIPRGFAGNDGAAGTPGSNGSDGAQGPPFTNFIVDGVNMLNPSDPASVQTTFDGSFVHMVFNIPRGFTGNDGGSGPQGSPGEVTNAQLSSAISGTSNNSNVVSTLDTPFANDPPTLADLEVMRAKMNELINALRR